MKIKISLSVKGKELTEEVIEIDDAKLEELTEEEIRAAVEVSIRNWADRSIQIAWETVE
jgi:urease beta subunit